ALDAELVIGVPPHRPPEVVRESGLTGDGEWVRVDPATLATSFERVFAIGDVTTIELANGLQLPKAGLFAELEGMRVAAAIAADVSGTAAPGPFDGVGYCFMETGLHAATKIEGDFFATPEPRIAMGEPSRATAEAKRRWEAERLERWFGA
ncbi:MAG: FAD/NAD(P)-binding oxidoreductase, partial [Gemmatimonadales bacterium]